MTQEVSQRDKDALLDDLGSQDEEMRRLAFERLLELPEADAVPRLLEGLGDSSWRVRKSVVERLIACKQSERIDEALIRALADGENPGRRNSAFEALVGIGERVTDKLVAFLGDEDVDVRKLVVDALGVIGAPNTCSAVIGMLCDEDANVRATAADALGVIGNSQAVEAMQRVAVDPGEDQLVRLSALRALGRTDHALGVLNLESALDDSLLRPAAYALLGQRADAPAIDCLLKGLMLSSRASREAAMAALLRALSAVDGARFDELVERIREAASPCDHLVEASIERLEHTDLADRMMLIQFLGLILDPRSVVPILRAGLDEAIMEVAHATLESMGTVTVGALRDGWSGLSAELRSDACRLLGRSKDGASMTQLLLASLEEEDDELRAAAAMALGESGCIDALPALVRRLEVVAADDDPESAEEVTALIDGLVTLASPDCPKAAGVSSGIVDLLSDRLSGAEDAVRLAIASVLGRIGRHEDAEIVAELLRDPNARVRRAAVEALSRLEPGAASEPLRLALADESALVRVAAAVALGNSENPAVVDDLSRLIHDEDSRVSAAAVRSIGTHCQRQNVSAERAVSLVSLALSGNGMVALAVVDALNMIGGPTAAVAAVGLLTRPEPEPVQAAVACIGAQGDGETVLELIGLIAHPSWSVRAEAIQTLSERRAVKAVPAILRRLETEQDSFVRDAILRALRQLEE